MKKEWIAVAGAGFSGAVVARILAEEGSRRVVVFEPRPHIGGNCHTERDEKTGVMIHTYGTHIFHTDDEEVWQFINRFGTLVPYLNRVKAITARGVFSLPINLLTLNQFFDRKFSPKEAEAFIRAQADPSLTHPQNFEEQALALIGRELYENFFYGYTKKQWGCEPRELPASILQRLPLRFNYEDSYYQNTYQAIPKEGYAEIIRRLLDHPEIEVRLNTSFLAAQEADFEHTFFTGCVDAYFNHCFGRLGYRTVRFEKIYDQGDYQGNPVLNYCEEAVPFTRLHEPKHLKPWESHTQTIILKEFSHETGRQDEPFYPKRLEADKKLLAQYQTLAQQEKKVTFLGRLGHYRYIDMDQTIREALTSARHYLQTLRHS